MKRHVLKNFRDLHYLKNTNGKHIKKGLIFRSGFLFNIDKRCVNKISNLKLDEIIDLRSDKEIKSYPDEIDNTKVVVAPFSNPEFNQKDDIDRTKFKTFYDNRKMGKDWSEGEFTFYKNIYSHILYNNDGIKEILNCLKNHKSFLFHCRGGKDRTGVSAFIILSILGFTKEEIFKDYLKTNNKFFYYFVKYISRIFGFSKDGRDALLVNTFAMKELLEASYIEIESKYGTVEKFLEKEYGLKESDIKDIKLYYLED